MSSEEPPRTTPGPDPQAMVRDAQSSTSPRPRRALSPVDWLVRVPIGFLWLGVLVIAAVPVMIYMTVLYWTVHWTSFLFGRKQGSRATGADRETRVA